MGLYIDERWDTFKMLCVDPGKHHLGVSIHELKTRTGEYVNIFVESIVVDKYPRSTYLDREFIASSDINLVKIRRHISGLCEDYGISVLMYEAPFYNRFMPAAYGSLCEVVACIRQAAIDYYPYILIDSMSPQNIKKGMGAGGTKGKEIMYDKVTGCQELMEHLRCPINQLTEHCIDSLAIGYNARKTILAPMEGWVL